MALSVRLGDFFLFGDEKSGGAGKANKYAGIITLQRGLLPVQVFIRGYPGGISILKEIVQ
jgi:hypothetical protein